MTPVWPRTLKLHELGHGPVSMRLAPDPEARATIARQLGLESLAALTAEITASAWFDGVELTGSFRADVEQICGVTLDAFEQPVQGTVFVRIVPPGSPHAEQPEGGDLELDSDAPDSPDILVNDAVDVAGYVVEHLALELDPFPRKPGATFEFETPNAEMSPFSALQVLRAPKA